MNCSEIANVTRECLSSVLRAEDFDIEVDAEAETVEISTDHWTIHLEYGAGFLAIDDEPSEFAQFRAAHLLAVPDRVAVALAEADRRLGGELTIALRNTGDPFTDDFADRLDELCGSAV